MFTFRPPSHLNKAKDKSGFKSNYDIKFIDKLSSTSNTSNSSSTSNTSNTSNNSNPTYKHSSCISATTSTSVNSIGETVIRKGECGEGLHCPTCLNIFSKSELLELLNSQYGLCNSDRINNENRQKADNKRESDKNNNDSKDEKDENMIKKSIKSKSRNIKSTKSTKSRRRKGRRPHLICIYEIRNEVTNKVYIGSSRDTCLRWNSHIISILSKKHASKALIEDWNKYGYSQFTFRILELIDNRYIKSNELRKLEQSYIDKVDNQNLYNLKRASAKTKVTKKD